jgi:cobalt-zinc-cadmium efflux system membrane fusion protein
MSCSSSRLSRWSALAILALAAANGACGNKASATTQEVPKEAPLFRQVVVDTETIKRLGIKTGKAGCDGATATISVPGSMEYDLLHYAEVGPRLDGRIVAVKVKLGDPVKKGDVLADLAVPSLAEAQAAFLTSNAALAAAKKNAEREKSLLEKNLTTAREAEVAQAELNKAQAESQAAKARLEALGVNGGGVGGLIKLVAPIDGTIVARNAVLGAFSSSTANAFVIADTAKLVATLEVHEADLSYLQLGSEVSFTADGLPGRTFKGKLTYIDPTVNKATRLVRARVQVDNSDGTLRPGMFIRAAIALPKVEASGNIALPPEAVQPLGNDDVVFVERSPDHFEVRKVVVARRTSEIVEIKEGLTKGETVVVQGAFLLRGEAAKQ